MVLFYLLLLLFMFVVASACVDLGTGARVALGALRPEEGVSEEVVLLRGAVTGALLRATRVIPAGAGAAATSRRR